MSVSTLWLYDVAESMKLYLKGQNSKQKGSKNPQSENKGEMFQLILSKNQELTAEGLKILSIVMTAQLAIMVAIEKSDKFNLVYMLSSFISIFTMAYVPICYYIISPNLKIVSGPKLFNSAKVPKIFQFMMAIILGCQFFQFLVLSRCGYEKVTTVTQSLRSAISGIAGPFLNAVLQITYYLAVDCLVPVSFIWAYKQRLN